MIRDVLFIDSGSSTVRGLAIYGFQLGSDSGPNGNNVIQGNFIGTDRTGTVAIGNKDRAVAINGNSFSTTIGGLTPGARNLISGNLDRGIAIDGTNSLIQGNYIGTDITGSRPLGNAHTGVEIGGFGNTIGGTVKGAGNVIAYNGADGLGATTNGVDVKPQTQGYLILGNSIFGNAGLGIDVDSDEATMAGLPEITSIVGLAKGTRVIGTYSPNTTFRLELFGNLDCDPSGFGEGQTLLNSGPVTSDGGGIWSITIPTTVVPGVFLAATADGITEFSKCYSITVEGRTNSWIQSAGGKWKTAANWSLGVSPFSGLESIQVTNAGTKTLVNDGTTASSVPTSMIISNLLISAPEGTMNTVLLSGTGHTPLRVMGFFRSMAETPRWRHPLTSQMTPIREATFWSPQVI